MKTLFKLSGLSFASGTLLIASFLLSGSALAGTIASSAHDLSLQGWSGGQICVVCHTPHNSDTTVADAPLWNHTITAAVFTMYAGLGSIDGVIDAQPTGSSKLCLSCHDGVTAVDSFGGSTGTGVNLIDAINPNANLGVDLRDDHPISITYDAVTDVGLVDPATAVTIGLGGDKARTGTISSLMLSANKVQCASCHDVHNGSVGVGADYAPLLKVSKAGSLLCLTCHDK